MKMLKNNFFFFTAEAIPTLQSHDKIKGLKSISIFVFLTRTSNIFIVYIGHEWDLNWYKVMISDGRYPILDDFRTHFLPKYQFAICMATGMKLDQMSVDYLVLCSNDPGRKVSAKSVTIRASPM